MTQIAVIKLPAAVSKSMQAFTSMLAVTARLQI